MLIQGGYLLAGILFSGAICLVFLLLYLLDVRSIRYVPLFSSEWKGLGGGLGGWRISRPLTLALVAIFFGAVALALIAQKLEHDHSDAIKRAEYEYELRKQREADDRKYHDADLARRTDLEKAKLAATPSGPGAEKKTKAADAPPKN